MPAKLLIPIDFFQDISKEGDLILMSQFLIHGENGVIFFLLFCQLMMFQRSYEIYTGQRLVSCTI